MSAEAESGAGELRGVLLPVGSRVLLLPNAAVAELIGYQEPEPDSSAPDWLLGQLAWRGRQVPVVSFQRAIGHPEPERASQRLHIAVLNTLNGNPKLPNIAVLTVGISRLAKVRVAALEADPEGAVDSPLVQEAVTVSDQPAWIPNLDELERQLTALP